MGGEKVVNNLTLSESFGCELEIGFLKLREDGLVIYLDEAASKLLGVTAEEVKGKVFLWEFCHGPKGVIGGKEAFTKFLERLKKGEEIASYNFCLFSKQGSSFYAVMKGKLVYEEKEPIIFAAIVKLPLDREIYFNLLRDIPSALFRISMDNRFEFIDDEGAKEILGYSAKDLIGKEVYEIHFDRVAADNLFREINRVLLEKDSVRVRQVLLKRADGTPVWVTSIIRGIYDKDGSLKGREGIMIRSSFLNSVGGELEDKDASLSMLGHDIRALVGSAISFLELLSESGLNEFQTNLLKKACVSVHGVRRLFENFIYSYRIRSGRLEVLEEPFDLNEVIDNIYVVISPYLKEGVEFKLDIPEFPYMLLGDSPKLEQILLNLLVNAAKVTTEGFVELSVKKIREDEVVEILFLVRDSGPGIPEEIKDRVFSPFKRFSTSYKGLGLGLYISKTLAKLMKGDLWLGESEKGSLFCLKLPFKRGEMKKESSS
ncbi:MAG: PAS domain-containing sensor histidine kinase [Synergistetes bacterium]|nr:PAS domain-containing sensor histidine kinase [Synergistota bacterium]MDW8192217.1 PAS domain-containing sensor histidine kinase [Synergistota bacterium]